MRLEDGPYLLSRVGLVRGPDGRLEFRWVVCVIVVDLRAPERSLVFHAPPGALIGRKRFKAFLLRHAERRRGPHGKKRVRKIVRAGNADVLSRNFGVLAVRGYPIDLLVLELVLERKKVRVVLIQDQKAPRVHVREKFEERLLHAVEISVDVEMLAVDVRHDRRVRAVFEEGALELVRLEHKIFLLALPEVLVPELLDLGADEHRGVLPPRGEHEAEKRRRGALAVRAGDRDRGEALCYLAYGLRVGVAGELQVPRALPFRVVTGNGVVVYHHPELPMDTARLVAEVNAHPLLLELLKDGGGGEVGALYSPALGRKKARKRAHADASDADEVRS